MLRSRAVARNLMAWTLCFIGTISAPAWGLGVESYDGVDASTIMAMETRRGLFSWDAVMFLSVDGKPVSGLRAQDSPFAKLRLRPGIHGIWVHYEYHAGFMKGGTSDIELAVDLKANGNYVLTSKRDGDRILLWVEESKTHERVSKVIGATTVIERKVTAPSQGEAQ